MKNDQKQHNDDYNYDYETTTNYANLDYQNEQYYYEYDYHYKTVPDHYNEKVPETEIYIKSKSKNAPAQTKMPITKEKLRSYL